MERISGSPKGHFDFLTVKYDQGAAQHLGKKLNPPNPLNPFPKSVDSQSVPNHSTGR